MQAKAVVYFRVWSISGVISSRGYVLFVRHIIDEVPGFLRWPIFLHKYIYDAIDIFTCEDTATTFHIFVYRGLHKTWEGG